MYQLRTLILVLCMVPLAQAQSNSCPADNANPCGAAPYFSIRSQGENAVREMVGWQELINLCSMDDFYGAISVVAEYNQSFRSNDIARVLFGSDFTNSNGFCCPSVAISGSTKINETDAPRGPNDWLAEYFGLPEVWKSIICFTPKIRNFIADIELYLGTAQWDEGLYFRLHMPIVWSEWDLHTREHILQPDNGIGRVFAELGYEQDYFDDDGVARTNLLYSALEFFNGTQAPNIIGESTGTVIQFDKLACSKWYNCCNHSALKKTRVADLEMIFGWNFVCEDDYYFGFNARAAAPTGNKPRGEFLFEPIVGNGGHWQLGLGIDTHATMWHGEQDSTLSFYLDANITHLFDACQTRCFDLCGKPNSRYMLAERFQPNEEDLSGDTIPGDTACTDSSCTLSVAQFAKEFSPVANLTMSNVRVSAAVQGDIALKFTYNNGKGFSWDLGYNFFGRSCEKICRLRGCTPDPLADGKTWGLKGDAAVFGFSRVFSAGFPLAPTESCATIHHGTNRNPQGIFFTADSISNPNIDNGEFAVINFPPTPDILIGTNARQTKTSIQPVFLTPADVDLQGTRIISNKIFTHFNYSWLNRETWVPFLGMGASVEVAHHKQDKVSENCCPSCRSTHASQGAIWIKGGAAWN